MKKYILIILFLTTAAAFAQDQTINGNLTVKELLTSKGLKLNYSTYNDWMATFIDYPGNSLTIRGPVGSNHECDLNFRPGSIDGQTRATWFNMFISTGKSAFQKKVVIHTNGNSYFNGGNIGIGTEAPQYKLHVEGEVYTTCWYRANGNKGFYFQSWGGGFNMTDATWIRTYGNKSFYHNTGVMRTDGIFHVGPNGDRLIVNTNGNVGIGVTNPQSKLEVNGTVRAKEVKLEATGWADFVFGKDYDLPELSEVEKHINEKQHLPGIPSEKEVLENGVNVVDMQAKLLQKIEELTLYVIEQDKKIEKQNRTIQELQNQQNN